MTVSATLRIQTGPFSDLGIYQNTHLDHHFGRPLPTIVDPYCPPNRAQIAHETAIAMESVRVSRGPSSASWGFNKPVSRPKTPIGVRKAP
jgi:hypothetical protein